MRMTMTDVAAELGVSPSTVSRAIRGDRRISVGTRERVREAVARLGFRPDPGAANLVAHRWNRAQHKGTVGVALIRHRDSAAADRDAPFFQEAAREQGFRLDCLKVDGPEDLARLPRLIRTRGLAGCLLEFVLKEEEFEAAHALAAAFPVVISNHRQSVEVAPSVVRDAYHRVQDALRRVIAQGYLRIGLCLPGGTSEMTEQMRAAYLLMQKKSGGAASLSLMTYHREEVRDLAAFIERRSLQAIVDFEDAALAECRRQDWEIPKMIGYASMAAHHKDIAGIRDTRREVIMESVKLLRLMIRAGQTGRELAMLRQELRGSWQDGPSLPDLADTI